MYNVLGLKYADEEAYYVSNWSTRPGRQPASNAVHIVAAPPRTALATLRHAPARLPGPWSAPSGSIRAAEKRSNEVAEPSALDACMQLALAGGALLARPPASPNEGTDADLERRERRFSATCDGSGTSMRRPCGRAGPLTGRRRGWSRR